MQMKVRFQLVETGLKAVPFSPKLDDQGFFWGLNPGLALIRSLQTLRACITYEYGKELTEGNN